jgi:hypothetical protein
MGGGGKSGSQSMPAPAVAEAPKPYQQEQAMSESAQTARDNQLRRARAALGQQGTLLTSPFGSQAQQQEGKTLLGG